MANGASGGGGLALPEDDPCPPDPAPGPDDAARRGPEAVARDGGLPDLGRFRSPGGTGLLLTPRRTGTDGFFLAQLRRRT